jgi:hypothetical protein
VTGLAHLRVYRFQPGAVFEGGVAGAIERMQVAADAELLDALFVTRESEGGAPAAIDLATGGADATFASLLDFRLDPSRRRELAERTLADHPRGVPRSLIEALAAALEPGAALLVVLDTGDTATALDDAVVRCGGEAIADESVDARTLAQTGPQLCATVGAPAPAL